MSHIKQITLNLPDSLLAEADRIASAEQIGRNEFICKAMKFYLEERKRRLLIEQMKKGYLEMANINLALAIEHYRLESEVMPNFELSTTEVK